MKKLLAFAIILTLFFSQAFAAYHYFDATDGDDANSPCTSSGSPCQTIAEAESLCGNGDTCYFASEESWTDGANANVLNIQEAGVTYDGSTWGTGTRARIYGSNAGASQHYGVVDIGASNVTFKGFEVDANEQSVYGINVGHGASSNITTITVDDCNVHGVNPASWGYGIIVSGWTGGGIIVSDVTINNCTVHDNDNEGIAFYDSWTAPNNSATGCIIQNCTIYNNLQGIIVAGNHDNVVIQDNDIYSNSTGIWHRSTDGATGSPDNLTIRRNTIHENSNGLMVSIITEYDDGFNGTAYNNFFYKNTTREIVFSHCGMCVATESADYTYEIYNNTFYNATSNNGSCIAILPYSNAIALYPDITIKNNIAYSTTAAAIYNHWAGTTFTYDFNLVYRSSGSSATHVQNVSTTYNRAEVISSWDSDAQNTDPNFVSIVGDDYDIQSPSDSIDNGTDLSVYFTDDYHEDTRSDGSFDIGADEVIASTPTLSSATIALDGNTLTLVFDQAVTQGVGYNDSDWNIDCSIAGNNRSITYSSGNGTTTHIYTIDTVILDNSVYGETCTIDFNGDADSEENGSGGDLAAISGDPVTNNSSQLMKSYNFSISNGSMQ